jgi:hypothetical protein
VARPFYRSELAGGAEVVWLLEVAFAGRVFRWASRPIDVTHDGGTYHYDGGLDSDDIELSLGQFAVEPDLISASISVVFPVSVAALVERGHDLGSAPGELSQIVAGSAYKDRRVVIDGIVSQPQYWYATEPVSFSLEESAHDDAGVWPDADAVVNATTWSTADAEVHGTVYPTVFGTPGSFPAPDGTATPCHGSPAIIVDITGDDNDKILIAGHRVAATTVTVIYNAGGSSFSGTVVVELDGLGREVSTVDTSGQSTGTAPRTASEYWIAWDHTSGGGMVSRNGTGTMTGLGDVAETVLGSASIAIDRGRFAGARQSLNAFLVSGYIDEPVVPSEWVADNLYPLAPMSIQKGSKGLYPVLWRYQATAPEAVEAFTIAAGTALDGPIGYERQRREVLTEYRIRWARNGNSRTYARDTTLSATRDSSDPESHSSQIVRANAGRYQGSQGPRVDVIETDMVTDQATALAVLAWRSVAFGAPHRMATISAPQTAGYLEPGDVVTITDAELAWTNRVALVRSVTATDSRSVTIETQVIDLPDRDALTA